MEHASSKSRSRGRRGEQDEAAKQKAKQKKMLIIGGAGVVGLVLLVAVASALWPRSEYVETRSATELQGNEKSNLERLMQKEIERATARGATPAEIAAIKANYQSSLDKVGK